MHRLVLAASRKIFLVRLFVAVQVGPVVHLRLVHDRETGKPKGYGFCEYNDPQTAESAIRYVLCCFFCWFFLGQTSSDENLRLQ